MWETILDFFNLIWAITAIQIIIKLILLLIVLFIMNKIISFGAKKYISISQRRYGDTGKRRGNTLLKLVKSTVRYFSVPIYVIFALPIIGIDPSTVFASAGLIGIVVGFAFQDLLKDIVSGFFLIFEHAYEVGDYVTTGKFTGTVVGLSVKTTRLEGFEGEIYVINNRDVANVINFSQASFAIVISRIPVAYETDIQQLKQVIEASIPMWMERYPQIIESPTYKGVDEIADSALMVSLFTKVKPMSQYQFRRDFNNELFEMCRKNNIRVPHTITEVELKEGQHGPSSV